MHHPWAGNILAMFTYDLIGDGIADLTPDLLPAIVEFFKHYGENVVRG